MHEVSLSNAPGSWTLRLLINLPCTMKKKHMMTGNLGPIFAAGHFSSAAENANSFPSVQPAGVRDFNIPFFPSAIED